MGTREEAKKLYNLKLHQSLNPESMYISVILRVPGGWIYEMHSGPVFVPYDNQFDPAFLPSSLPSDGEEIPF